MRIKTQFAVCIVVFSVILVVIAASVTSTEQQVTQLNAQKAVASNIEQGASRLNSVSIDYFLYQEDLQISRWQTQLSSLSSDLSNLKPNNVQQQTLVNSTAKDLQTLNSLFNELIAYLQNAPRNVSVRIDPAFQTRWSGLALQSQTLNTHATQLSRSIDEQAQQVNETNILLIVSLVGTFGALLATIYLMVFRKTLRSVSELQKGIKTIGSGNLSYVIEAKRNDEISDLSRAFNQMTADLKNVTASKTDLEQAQASLQQSEQRWATTLSSIGDSVIATDVSGAVTFMNTVAEESTGWTLREALGKPLKEVFHIINEETRMEVESPVAKVLEKGMIIGLANHTILVRKDGSEVPLDDSGAPIKDQNGVVMGVVLVFHNISERKEMELRLEEYSTHLENLVEERTRQLKDSERLAAIGATAGMVGHDIRNPLQAITGDLYLAKTDLALIPESEEKQSIQESLDAIENNIDYIAKIVQDLQDYARPLNPKPEEADLKLIVTKLFAKNNIPDNIKLSIKVENSAEKISTDSHYINRIMFNLINNAVQAMPNGGKLTVHAFRGPKDLVMTVKDTGVGIPKEIQGKMFTPMFTTKAKGQGFGLPVVKRMTESLGGTVTFESQEGKGTSFTVRLPLNR